MTLDLLEDIVNYRRLFTDIGFWQPYILSAMEKVQLPCTNIRGGIPGTYPTFIVDDTYVIKFFGRLFDGIKSFETEYYANRLVRQRPGIPVPELVAQGLLLEENDHWNWPFLVFEFLDGISIGESWEALAQNERQQIAKEMGQIVRAIHTIPLVDDGYFQKDWQLFRKFIESQKLNCYRRLKKAGGVPEHLLSQLEDFLLPVEELIDFNQSPHLIHADLTRDHLLGKVINGHWTTQGIIDFGDAMAGNLGYELVALHFDLFKGDKQMLRIFLESYGIQKFLCTDFSFMAMNITLLHQFGEYILADLFGRLPQLEVMISLDDLAEKLWGLGKPAE